MSSEEDHMITKIVLTWEQTEHVIKTELINDLRGFYLAGDGNTKLAKSTRRVLKEYLSFREYVELMESLSTSEMDDA